MSLNMLMIIGSHTDCGFVHIVLYNICFAVEKTSPIICNNLLYVIYVVAARITFRRRLLMVLTAQL